MWTRIVKFFKDSEVIFLARLQMFIGAISAIGVWIVQNPEINNSFKTIVKPQYIPVYIIILGALTEYARRRRSETDDQGRLK